MCTYSYYHHHHYPPCQKPIEIFLTWAYCKRAPFREPTSSAPGGRFDEGTSTTIQPLPRQPCSQTSYANPAAAGQIDPLDPCASGGCVASSDCISGVCRLGQLGGSWVCCVCKGDGNRYTWCAHPPVTSPDSFCYHVVCATCWRDEQGDDNDNNGAIRAEKRRKKVDDSE
jgi:hypothetical protein